ncbi:TVP38/TMEM64 family protein [Roseospira visakhapatnamensis]|uniref:Putative membrane protein YdjX (TVP38/TMEM64 family) n=1 Tax=Roseospira visakhapatnamensis TaxID=390880 RepID=A0A7W6WAM6_9PROT|nr:TVP38/TMEM64 family protein [Roseospira visakhapatnamensis]MBB4267003.1 putative membrane protein YdjX (TVP38/TMEM64 family) [Roseospira visakhapatnamensis]
MSANHTGADPAAGPTPPNAGAAGEAPATGAPDGLANTRRGWTLRLGLLVLLVAGLAAFVALGGPRLLSFDTLGRHHAAIAAWVSAHQGMAVVAFVLTYVLAVTFSVPGAVWLSIAGGYLFGTVLGSALVVLAATLGATAVFLAARTILGDGWRRRAFSGTGRRLAERLRDSAFTGLLVLRLVPVFPFWLVNLVPAFLDVSVRVYVLATLLGIIPGAVVFAGVGAGLDRVLAAGDQPDLGVVYDPQVLGPLLGLAVLALLPTLWRRWKGPEA